jgi:hypothetical protein
MENPSFDRSCRFRTTDELPNGESRGCRKGTPEERWFDLHVIERLILNFFHTTMLYMWQEINPVHGNENIFRKRPKADQDLRNDEASRH